MAGRQEYTWYEFPLFYIRKGNLFSKKRPIEDIVSWFVGLCLIFNFQTNKNENVSGASTSLGAHMLLFKKIH
jgi:hypothetical protein